MIPIFSLLEASDIATGVLFSAKAALQVCSSPVMTRYIDTHQRAMILGGLTLQITSVLVFYAVSFQYWLWLCARALSGVASAAIISAGMAHLKTLHPDHDERAKVMGWATTGIIAGVCLGPLFGGVLHDFNPRLPFISLALLEVLVLCLTMMFLPGVQSCAAAETSSASVRDMLADPFVWKPLSGLMAANAAISCLESTVSRYFMVHFDFSPGQVGAFYLNTSVPSIIASGFAGHIGNYFGRRRAIAATLVLQGLFMMLGPKSLLSVEVLSFAGIGFAMGGTDGMMPALLGEFVDERFGGSGKIYVLSNVAVQVGFVLGPILGNAVTQLYGFQACCVVLGGMLVLCSAVFSSLPKSHSLADALLA